MACSLRVIFGVLLVAGSTLCLPSVSSSASAAELDKKSKADAKEAMLLYKEGHYEDAAKIFVNLSVGHPDMLVFVRNLGACYYYLRRNEPALSNLRDYVHRKKDITADDRAEVEGWIGELERFRGQVSAPPVPPPVASVPASAAPVEAPAVPLAPAQASADVPPAPSSPSQPADSGYPPAEQYGPQPGYPQGSYGPQPGYPPGQYAPQTATQYPPAEPGYPPAYQPAAYPPGGSAPAGVTASPDQPGSGGHGKRVAAWVLGGVGVAAVVTGAAFTFLAEDKFSKVEKKYDPGAEKQGKNYATAQWVFYGVGAASLATALVLGLSSSGAPSAVALVPVVGPGSAGATLNGAF